MKIIKYLASLLIFSSLVTCTKPYTINFDDIEKRLVINSFFNPDSLMSISLYEEASLNESTKHNSFKTIDNAQVIISENNIIIDTATFTKAGIYLSNFLPKKNITYKINVRALGYDNITAESRIPKLVKIDSLIVEKINDEDYNNRVKIVFTDPSDEKNYYLFSVYWLAKFDNITQWYEATYKSNDPAIGKWIVSLSKMPIFNDDLFNGQKYELDIELHSENNEGRIEHGYCYFNLFSLSKDMYLYLQSYNNQTPGFDNLYENFQQGLMEPLPIYTNIESGLGIFAGYAISQDSVYLE